MILQETTVLSLIGVDAFHLTGDQGGSVALPGIADSEVVANIKPVGTTQLHAALRIIQNLDLSSLRLIRQFYPALPVGLVPKAVAQFPP